MWEFKAWIPLARKRIEGLGLSHSGLTDSGLGMRCSTFTRAPSLDLPMYSWWNLANRKNVSNQARLSSEACGDLGHNFLSDIGAAVGVKSNMYSLTVPLLVYPKTLFLL